MSRDYHPRVVSAAKALSTVIHGQERFVRADDGSCVLYDHPLNTGYIIHERTGIERIYEGPAETESIARRSSDAVLKSAALCPSLCRWVRA